MNLTQRPIYQKGQVTRAPKLRRASASKSCTLHIPGVCSGDPAKTVGCHLRIPGFCGTALKPSDLLIVDACSHCHSVLDNRARWAEAQIGWDDVLRALAETLTRREAEGLIEVVK